MVNLPSSAKLAARRDARSRRKDFIASFALSKKPRKKTSTRKRNKKTPEEKKRDAARREEANKKYFAALDSARDRVGEEAQLLQDTFGGHSAAYYEREILQRPKLSTSQRKTSCYNAWLRVQLRELNAKLPQGAKKYTATHPAFREMVKEKWGQMSEEEKAEASAGPLKELEELKEVKGTTKHSVSINAFHDVRSTLRAMHEEAKRLKVRTGAEIALVVVRGDRDHFPAPSVFTTSDLVDQFFHLAYNSTLDEFAWRLEAFVLSGLYGVLKRREDALQELQAKAAALIAQKLAEITDHKAKKMYYSNFPAKITLKHHIVIVNWPLRELAAPSSLRSTTELELLINAWSTSVTRFRKLSATEYNQWKAEWTASREKNPDASADASEDEEDAARGQPSSVQAQARIVNPVTATDGTPVAVTETGPRKRRSDFQGTHKSKKRRAGDENEPPHPSEIPAIPTPPHSAVPTRPPSAVPTRPPSAVSMRPPSAIPTRPPSAVPTRPPSSVPTRPPSAVSMRPPSAIPTRPPSAVPTRPLSAVPGMFPAFAPMPSRPPSTMPPPAPPISAPSPQSPFFAMPPPPPRTPAVLLPQEFSAMHPPTSPEPSGFPLFQVPPSDPHFSTSGFTPSPSNAFSSAPSPRLPTSYPTTASAMRALTPSTANAIHSSAAFQNSMAMDVPHGSASTRWAQEQDPPPSSRPGASSPSSIQFPYGLGVGPSSSRASSPVFPETFGMGGAAIRDPLMDAMLSIPSISRSTTPAARTPVPLSAPVPTSPFHFSLDNFHDFDPTFAYTHDTSSISYPTAPTPPVHAASMTGFPVDMGPAPMPGPSRLPTPSSARPPSRQPSTSWVQDGSQPKPKPRPKPRPVKKTALPTAGSSSQPT